MPSKLPEEQRRIRERQYKLAYYHKTKHRRGIRTRVPLNLTQEERRLRKNRLSREWKAKNAEKVRASGREYSRSNRSRLREYKKAWRPKNRQRINAQDMLYRQRRTKEQKEAKRQYMLTWRANNLAHIRAYAHARYRQKSKHICRLQKARKKRRSDARKAADREYQRQWMADWRAANPKLARAKKRKLMHLNRERYLAVRRATAAKPENKLKAALRFRRWAQSNLGKTYFKERFHRRRARERFVETANCLERIRELRNAKICSWCGSAMERVTIDHVIPIACGGSHTPENLVACCVKCNSSKRSLLPSEWAARIRRV